MLDQESKEVKRAYFIERQFFYSRVRGDDIGFQVKEYVVKMWDGGQDERGVRHQPVWPKIIKFAMKHGYDPKLLIKAVFSEWLGSEPPRPHDMLSELAIDAYKHYQWQYADHIKLQMQAHEREAQLAFSIKSRSRPDSPPSYLWREIITSPAITAGPLFRFCLAHSTCQLDLAEAYEDAALHEYLKNTKEYDKVLTGHLPDGFRDKARRLLARMTAV